VRPSHPVNDNRDAPACCAAAIMTATDEAVASAGKGWALDAAGARSTDTNGHFEPAVPLSAHSGRSEAVGGRSAMGRKPKFKIRLDGGLPITDGRPLGTDLSRSATGLRRWRQERGRTAARDTPEVDLLHCRYPLMHPQFSCHPMGHTTPIPGRCTRKRITDPAPVGMVSEVAARDKRQPGGPQCRRNPVVVTDLIQ
jgi:hypothetical protein